MKTGFLLSLSHFGSRIMESHRRSRTRVALEQLSDRQLADIGVTRADIPRVLVHGHRR